MESWSESQLLGIDKDHGWKASLPFQKHLSQSKLQNLLGLTEAKECRSAHRDVRSIMLEVMSCLPQDSCSVKQLVVLKFIN